MLTNYRQALSLPGAWQFSSSGFLARLPIAMVGLGIVLLISETTGSYARAGLLAAAFQVASAAGALVTSRLMDRRGQARLLPWLAAGHAVGLAAFLLAVESGSTLALQIATVAAAGALQPAIGAMVRARWAHAAPDGDRLRSAFALESIVDELIFTVGPLLTALLAFQVGLPTPIILSAVLTAGGSIALTLQRRTQPPPRPVDRTESGPRGGALGAPGMLFTVVAALGIGSVFGGYEVSVVAFAEQAGAPGASGVILGLYAFGSLVGGLLFGARHWSVPLPRQVLVLTGGVTAVLLPAPFVGSLAMLAPVTFVAGLAVAPALIALFSLTERLVPAARLTEGLTWTNSGLALGFSAGTALGGIVIDARGTTASFVIPIVGAASATVVLALGRRVLTRAATGRPQPGPVVTWVTDPLPGPTAGGVIDDPDS